MKLPFTSSIFSSRQYRSLPDLSTIGTGLNHISSEPSFSKGHSRKRTEGNIDRRDVERAISDFPPPQSPNRSLSTPKIKSTKKSGEKFELEEPSTSKLRKQPTIKTEPNTPVKTVTFAPPRSDSTSESSDSEESVKTVEANDDKQSDIIPSSASLDIIADGALSDSEIDKTRKSPEVHNDTVWKWGEFPQSTKSAGEKKKDLKADKTKASESYWSWFFGKAPPEPKGDEVYLDDLLNKEANPDQMEKYFGRNSKKSCSSTVSTDDSGNGRSDHNPMTSPSAGSTDSLNTDQGDSTPKVPTPTQAEIKKAVEKKAAIELEMLAGTDQYDDKPNTQLGKKVKERQKSGNSTSDASYISDEEPVEVTRTQYIRSLRLSSDELKALHLQYGSNEARFSVTTKFQGTSWCSCHIYLFRYSEKIVISDIDGTITKSDVLGHVIAAIGGTWAHAGVAELYSRIKNNG